MNRELLIKVRDQIAAHPEHFNMAYFWQTTIEEDVPYLEEIEEIRNYGCGATACIAGWGIVLTPNDVLSQFDLGNETTTASKLFDINYDQAFELFSRFQWDEPYRSEYQNYVDIKSKVGMAKVACNYIDHFIQKYSEATNAS